MSKRKFPNTLYAVQDANGKIMTCEKLEFIPVYYDENDGIIVAQYQLIHRAKVRKETLYEILEESDEKS